MPASGRQKFLLLGDSLTQLCFEGWGSDLADVYQGRADVLNRGVSGYNSRWYLRYAEDTGIWDEPGKVALVTIFFGANDAVKEFDPAHVPLPEFTTNIEKIVDKVKESYPNSKILLIAPPPVHLGQRVAYQKKRWGDKATGVVERSSEITGTYAAACREVGKTKKVPCMDLFTAMRTAEGNTDEDDNGRFFYDGLHFNKTGHKFVYDTLANAIHTHFPTMEVHPCPKTGQFNNSSSLCNDIENSGPYSDIVKAKRKWQEAFD
jgi:lysophospholipase L1-like esterase